ncbi:MAG: hypothetical protein KKC79_14535, partial [Gammaproteobacteria bacterium]|nr:hypothetical protein [Gammaproteobacteria bacterium]
MKAHRLSFVARKVRVAVVVLASVAGSASAQDICASGASLVNPARQGSRGLEQSASPSLSSAPLRRPSGSSPARAARGGEEGGIGGTGVVAESKGSGNGNRTGEGGAGGIGGTGVMVRGPDPGGGIGGTGIVGTITGFASICVNGLEVDFDADTPVFDNGRASSARDLVVGQVVAVRAARRGARLHAESIAMQFKLVGPIDAVDASNGTFRVLGERVSMRTRSAVTALQSGVWVRVSGHRQADGSLVASSVEPLSTANARRAEVAGRIEALTSTAMQVSGTRVELDGRTMAAGLERGQEVRVTGLWKDGRLSASNVMVSPTLSDVGRVQDVVLEGYVQSLEGDSMSLGSGKLQVDAGARS